VDTELRTLADVGEVDLYLLCGDTAPQAVPPPWRDMVRRLGIFTPVTRRRWPARQPGPAVDLPVLHTDPSLANALGAWSRGQHYDMVWYDGLAEWSATQGVLDAPAVLDIGVDVRSALADRAAANGRSADGRTRRAERRWCRDLHNALGRVARVVVRSNRDIERLGLPRAHVVPHAVPEIHAADPGDRGGTPTLLGGDEWLNDKVLPLVRSEFPGVVAGQPAPRQQGVMVVPRRWGGWADVDTIHAMASGFPVVATPAAVSRTDAFPGVHLEVAANAEEFALRIVALLGSTERRHDLIRTAQRHLRETHTEQAVRSRVAEVTRGLLNED
jgi:hypothetical protein